MLSINQALMKWDVLDDGAWLRQKVKQGSVKFRKSVLSKFWLSVMNSFLLLSRLRLLRAPGAEDGRPPLRRHDGVVPHVRHLRRVLHAPRARQGKTDRRDRTTTTHIMASSFHIKKFKFPPEKAQD